MMVQARTASRLMAAITVALLVLLGCAVGTERAHADSITGATTSVTKASKVKSVAMHRMYNPNTGEHLYTADVSERENLKKIGWYYEGVGWVAPSSSKTPVYRLFNPYSDDHHYTVSAKERDELVKIGWNDEGIGWYSDDAKTVALHRLFNPNEQTATHHYTDAADERDWLAGLGWRKEGVGWYATAKGKHFAGPDVYDPQLSTVDWTIGKKAFVAEWTKRIDAYFKNTELSGYGARFAEMAWKYGVDPRVSPAITYTESGKGRICTYAYNAWGWGHKSWDSWEESIEGHISGFAKGYGYNLTPESAVMYSGGMYTWYDVVVEQMAKI